jgi:molybdopterin-guanine dinucleotide biosynthesis protein A
MGGKYKAFEELGGQTMLDIVLGRLSGQVASIMVSTEPDAEGFQSVRHTLIEDLVPSHRGPLVGLYSALQYLTDRLDYNWLLMVPCDAPLLPLDLAEHLCEAADATGQEVVTVSYDGHVQPTFSLWHRHALTEVRVACLKKNAGGLMHMLDLIPHAVVEWPDQDPPPFFNVNTPQDLEQAASWLQG